MGILHRPGQPRKAIRVGILLLLAVLLHGCGGGGSNTTNSAPVSTTTVDGMVSKGPVADATITLFPLLPNGQRGNQVAPGAGQSAITTRGNGAWRATIPRTVTGPLLVVATGGTFSDEVTGTQVPVGNTTEFLGLVPAGETAAAVTPVTHALALATQTALQTAAAAGPAPDVNAMVATVITRATETFGFDPVRTLPPDPHALQGQSTAAV